MSSHHRDRGLPPAIQSEWTKLETRQQQTYQTALKQVNTLLAHLEQTQSHLDQPLALAKDVKSITKEVNDLKSSLTTDFKNLFNSVTAYGKTLDKHCIADTSILTRSQSMDDASLLHVIIDSLCREGRFEVVEKLIQESSLPSPPSPAHFHTLHSILTSLHQHHITPCLTWLIEHSNVLGDTGYQLQFDLHRLQFIQILMGEEGKKEEVSRHSNISSRDGISSSTSTSSSSSTSTSSATSSTSFTSTSPSTSSHPSSSPSTFTSTSSHHIPSRGEYKRDSIMYESIPSHDEHMSDISNGHPNGYHPPGPNHPTVIAYHHALAYAQQYFPPFATTRMSDICQLSGSLLFIHDLYSSPYRDLFIHTSILWTRVCQQFESLFYHHVHIARHHPAYITLLASDMAIPKILKFYAVMKQNADVVGTAGVAQTDEYLPVEIDLGKELQYHSTFVCPVTKDPCSHENPPVMLKCGHLISRAAMDKIVRASRLARRFKCPTCPKEQAPNETIEVHL